MAATVQIDYPHTVNANNRHRGKVESTFVAYGNYNTSNPAQVNIVATLRGDRRGLIFGKRLQGTEPRHWAFRFRKLTPGKAYRLVVRAVDPNDLAAGAAVSQVKIKVVQPPEPTP
jgi:hypothetical protein